MSTYHHATCLYLSSPLRCLSLQNKVLFCPLFQLDDSFPVSHFVRFITVEHGFPDSFNHGRRYARRTGTTAHSRVDRTAANLASQMAAISASTVTCELHEHCDGSCSGNGPVEFQPLQVGHHPYRATVPDRPLYDLPLVQDNPTQIPSEDFQYTPINSASGEIRVLRLHEAVFRSDAVVVGPGHHQHPRRESS
jgi:hypothetical protein